jgi:hypothetical protein
LPPRSALPWLAAASLALVLAAAGWRPAATGGIAVGLFTGTGYLWLLGRRAGSLPGLPARRALLAAQAGAVLRLCFVFLGFACAARLWPGVNLAWGAAAVCLPTAAAVVRLARGG